MLHGCPCRVLILSTSQDHEADVLEGWQQHQTSLTFPEVCSGADLLTLLDLLDHAREEYFSVLCLLPRDDSAGQQPTRTRSKPLGLDGLCPNSIRIIRGINQHTELTARFAQQALLCSVHKVATVLIIPEDLGGHPATGPPSLWMMTELQTKEGLDDAHRGAGFSCQLGNAEQGLATGVLSNLSPVSLLLHRGGHSYSTFTTRSQILSTEALFQRRVPARHRKTSLKLQQMARAIFSQVTLLAAFSGGSISTASNQQTPSGWRAKLGQLQIIRYGRLLTSRLPFPLAPTLFSLFWTSGSAGTSREVHCAFTRATPSLASSSFLGLHLQPWLKDALLWLRVARFPSGPLRRLFLRVCRSFHFSSKRPRVIRTLQAEETGWRTSQLDCLKVGVTRQAKETGWKPFQLTCQRLGRTRQHQVGEEFLNSEVASEVPALLSTRRICGTGGLGGGIQRTSSASLNRGRSSTTIDYGNTPELRLQGRWQCSTSLRGLWFF